MKHRALRGPSASPGNPGRPPVPCLALALALAAGLAVGGCAAGAGAAPAGPSVPPSHASAPVYGPPGPDLACAAALTAERTLRARQGQDQSSESAIDRDFMNFARALGAAARHEAHPATARVMTALADDYTALVESQSGAAQLPAMSTVQRDGAAFDRACP